MTQIFYFYLTVLTYDIAGVTRLEPKFTLLDKSLDGTPSIEIEFPDGYKDTLVLKKFYGNDEDKMAKLDRCHYIGRLANESESGVAMTGCVKSEDVEFTILSNHSKACQIFKWRKNDEVEIIKCWPRVGL